MSFRLQKTTKVLSKVSYFWSTFMVLNKIIKEGTLLLHFPLHVTLMKLFGLGKRHMVHVHFLDNYSTFTITIVA